MFDMAVVSQTTHQDANGTRITVVGESNSALHDNALINAAAKAAFGTLSAEHLKDDQ